MISRGCQLFDRSAAEIFLKQAFLITNVPDFCNYVLIVLWKTKCFFSIPTKKS